KEISEFPARVSRCNSCMIEYRNSPEVKAKAKKYNKENREQKSEYNKAYRVGYYAKNKERLLEEKKVWRRENRELNNEIIRNWRAKQRKEGGRYAIMEKLRVRFNQAIFHGKNGGR